MAVPQAGQSLHPTHGRLAAPFSQVAPVVGAGVPACGVGIGVCGSAESCDGARVSHSSYLLWSRVVWLVEPEPEAVDAGVCAVLFLRGQYGRGDWAVAVSSWSTIRDMAQGAAVSDFYAMARAFHGQSAPSGNPGLCAIVRMG